MREAEPIVSMRTEGSRRSHRVASVAGIAFAMRAILVLGAMTGALAYYLPGTFPTRYEREAPVTVKVNSLRSVETELPFDYYSLPFCKPEEGVVAVAENLGEMLMGTRIESSPYVFHMGVVETDVKLCTVKPLSKKQTSDLKGKIKQGYMVNMILDNLPVTVSDLDDNHGSIVKGFPLGYYDEQKGKYYIYNHLSFNVLVNEVMGPSGGNPALFQSGEDIVTVMMSNGAGQNSNLNAVPFYMIVGFEVLPCSANYKSEDDLKAACDGLLPYQEVEAGKPITFTYSVYWETSSVTWNNRWDAYLRMDDSNVHWISILNSALVVIFLTGIILIILLRTIRRDLTKYEELVGEVTADEVKEESGWKLLAGDVFRPPPKATLLCIFTGSGAQILSCSVATGVFAALGFMSPAARGGLLSTLVVVYLLMGLLAGYTSVKLSYMITGQANNWKSLSLKVAYFFPGIVLMMLAMLNIVIHHTGSSGEVPFSIFVYLIFLWVVFTFPLSLLGGYLATRKAPPSYPTRTNQIPREVPESSLWMSPFIMCLGAGALPFGTMFIELYFVMSSIWEAHFYYVFGFLSIAGVLTIIICTEVAVVITYIQLCMEDHRWWWASFFSSGSVAFYTFVYAIGYLMFDLSYLSGMLSIFLYLCYTGIFMLGMFFALGTVGFLASYYFVYKLFDSVKAD